MVITDFLERNARLYGAEMALVEGQKLAGDEPY